MDKGKKTLLLMIFVFVAPMVIGTVMFLNIDRLGIEGGSTNYGKLIQPAKPAKLGDLQHKNQPAKKQETIGKRWTLAYLEPDTCDQACKDKLILIKKVRLLTNEKMRRVRTLFVTSNSIAKQFDKTDYGNLVVASVKDKKAEFLKQFPAQESNPIYLIDPLGNIMMYYPQQKINVKKMLKDIKRLLKYSSLG